MMNTGNSLLENGLYGIRLNPTDISQSASFQPGQNDPTATVVNKLKGAIGFFNYANAQTYAQQTGVAAPSLQIFLQQSGYHLNPAHSVA
jgi:ABC-type phosphate transport system substrate-binding protein